MRIGARSPHMRVGVHMQERFNEALAARGACLEPSSKQLGMDRDAFLAVFGQILEDARVHHSACTCECVYARALCYVCYVLCTLCMSCVYVCYVCYV